MRILFLAAAPIALLAAPAAAQADQALPRDDRRINQLIVYGDDACPESTDSDIFVCARKPESERYRIPDNLRDDPNAPENRAWTNTARDLQYVGRSGIGSCTPSGPGGMIGCTEEQIRMAQEERSGRDEVNWNRLIEEARQERLSTIDERSEAIERELRAREPE